MEHPDDEQEAGQGRLEPSGHVISEYANSKFGWLMVIALLCVAQTVVSETVSREGAACDLQR